VVSSLSSLHPTKASAIEVAKNILEKFFFILFPYKK